MKNLRLTLLFFLIAFTGQHIFAQQQVYTSDDNISADWLDFVWTKKQSWMEDRPRYAGNNVGMTGFGYWQQLDIYGYITRNGDLTVDGGGALHIYDTLRITGNLYSYQVINIHSGGVLIVEGDYDAANGGVNTVGGKVVVLGEVSVHDSGQINISGGDFYALGGVTTNGSGESFNGSGTPPTGYFGDETDLENDDPGLHSFATGGTLPVEFVQFSVSMTGEKVVALKWATATEINNDFFTVERSIDGKTFTSIGELEGNGTTHELHQYTFTDNNPLKGKSYYRIRQTDFDGAYDFSIVQVLNNGSSIIESVDFFPNPAVDKININIASNGNVTVKLIDVAGILKKEMAINGEETPTAQMRVDDLQRGLYLLVFNTGEEQITKRVLIK